LGPIAIFAAAATPLVSNFEVEHLSGFVWSVDALIPRPRVRHPASRVGGVHGDVFTVVIDAV